MNVLLSIKPKYVEAMAEGRKSFEFRKSMFRNESIERVYLYSTHPVGKIVGSFKVGRVISATPRLLWEKVIFFLKLTRQWLKIMRSIYWELEVVPRFMQDKFGGWSMPIGKSLGW